MVLGRNAENFPVQSVVCKTTGKHRTNHVERKKEKKKEKRKKENTGNVFLYQEI